ncbi:MAG: MarR family transcriptional regulator [Rhodospirillales bacterium]|nr:MarR family transcriptional regulator [Rhodospirillales bacterium]
MTTVDEVRRFNRFYTRQIGLLDEHLSNSPFSLPEARVLYELASGKAETAAQISRSLSMDKGYLSRILSRFRARGLVTSRVSPDHAKHRLLSLTQAGRKAFAALERGTVDQMEALLSPLDPAATERLARAMQGIEAILSGAQAPRSEAFTLRAPKVGDLGWVIHRQSVLYAEEYGWDRTYEGLASSILGEFVARFDPAKEHAWIAERDGKIAGSIFLVKSDDPSTAQLRLLYVEPSARGLGIGAALVAACIDRARANGCRTLMLWTNDVLVAARRLYEAAGFRLIAEERHRSFGHDLVGQTWTLEL